VGANLWVTTRALPWAELFGPFGAKLKCANAMAAQEVPGSLGPIAHRPRINNYRSPIRPRFESIPTFRRPRARLCPSLLAAWLAWEARPPEIVQSRIDTASAFLSGRNCLDAEPTGRDDFRLLMLDQAFPFDPLAR
jgi:hypothetical protein